MNTYGAFITISLNECEGARLYIAVKAKNKKKAQAKVLKSLKKVTKVILIKY